MNIHAIVLAAGKGTRMKSRLYKVMHPVCGKPMIAHVVDMLDELPLDKRVVVIGHGSDAVRNLLGERVRYAYQHEQLGTAHAVLMSREMLQHEDGVTIVLNGDTPLVRSETLKQLLLHHTHKQAAATILTAIVENPAGYGRVIRDERGDVIRIVEEKDATLGQKKISEISTGIFCFDNRKLFAYLAQVKNENAQAEYYLPDVISILHAEGCTISAYVGDDPDEGRGANDRAQLAQLEALLRRRINQRHMQNGVSLIDPAATYIDADVEIGQDSVIYPGTFLRGKTKIEEGCSIGPHVQLVDCQVLSGTSLSFLHAKDRLIQADEAVGQIGEHIHPRLREIVTAR
ncbi:bifunctional N-acetylglucosamine-1-phosphate uridyltransferase/glucosamine-1-phosphate acetyltransferase [Brevibacillus sp. TJ4]|uniref:bifunctional UDP-N-acetylglucosamine diphosphorylase/glucosamine-1-phosphate N-acetyltransferase GlmU n=1 Tax=Brevibacillus sp. TJ4 TaxID=3234853 RepID=UPI0037CF5C61